MFRSFWNFSFDATATTTKFLGQVVIINQLSSGLGGVGVTIRPRALDNVEPLGDGGPPTLVFGHLVADPVDPTLLLNVHAVAEPVLVDQQRVAVLCPGEFHLWIITWKTGLRHIS